MIVTPRGPQPARFLIVGEAPGANEERVGSPFVGASGQELNRMLQAAGINPDECRFTNVTNQRPPGNDISKFFRSSKKAGLADGATYHRGKWAMPVLLDGIEALHREIIETQPELVIGLGNAALWACTGQWAVTKWRGSQLHGEINGLKFKFIPTLHPAYILRVWGERWLAVEDLKRATRPWQEPNYDFLVRPSFSDVIDYLDELAAKLERSTLRLSVDIETRNRQIACIGLADTDRRAVCIPILCVDTPEGYWSVEEETEIIWRLKHILEHPNVWVVGQNFIYDMQYFARQYGINVRLRDDTMIKHHVCFPGTKKGLDTLSSIYCRWHTYWKDESKEWDPKIGEDQLWVYNCKDCCTTFESNEELSGVLQAFDKVEQYAFQMRTAQTAYRMMLRGIRVDTKKKAQSSLDLSETLIQIRDWITYLLGGFDIFGPKGGVSPKKMFTLAYDILMLPPKYVTGKGKRRLTANADAIDEWATTVEPLFRPLLQAIADYRSVTVYKSTFADAGVDWDNRFRCTIYVAGPVTFRFSTGEDAFGFGTNMQNIPRNQ